MAVYTLIPKRANEKHISLRDDNFSRNFVNFEDAHNFFSFSLSLFKF